MAKPIWLLTAFIVSIVLAVPQYEIPPDTQGSDWISMLFSKASTNKAVFQGALSSNVQEAPENQPQLSAGTFSSDHPGLDDQGHVMTNFKVTPLPSMPSQLDTSKCRFGDWKCVQPDQSIFDDSRTGISCLQRLVKCQICNDQRACAVLWWSCPSSSEEVYAYNFSGDRKECRMCILGWTHPDRCLAVPDDLAHRIRWAKEELEVEPWGKDGSYHLKTPNMRDEATY